MSKDNDKIGKKIVSSSKITEGSEIRYEATFDDGDRKVYKEISFIKSASRYPRWVDYVIRGKENVVITKEEDNL